jgi:hypothetical protein
VPDASRSGYTPASLPVPTYGNQKWTDRTAYIDTLITKLENTNTDNADGLNKGDIDTSMAAESLSAAWFLTNMEDPLDLDIFKTLYCASAANPTQDRGDVDNYYSEMGGATVDGVTVDARVTERRTLFKGFVDGTAVISSDMGRLYYDTLKNRCDKLITAADTTTVWDASTIKTQFTTILDEINSVTSTAADDTGTGRWDDGYDWYTKGRLLLLETDNGDFIEADMYTVIKTLREELLLLYYKALDTRSSGDSDLNSSTYGRAASLFKMLDYMVTIETGDAATEAAYDKEKYLKALWDAKETDTDEDLTFSSSNSAGEDIAILRTYEQIYGELT